MKQEFNIGDEIKIIVDDKNDMGGFLKGEIYQIEAFNDSDHDNIISTHKNGNRCIIAINANGDYPKEAELYIEVIENKPIIENYDYLIPILKKLNIE